MLRPRHPAPQAPRRSEPTVAAPGLRDASDVLCVVIANKRVRNFRGRLPVCQTPRDSVPLRRWTDAPADPISDAASCFRGTGAEVRDRVERTARSFEEILDAIRGTADQTAGILDLTEQHQRGVAGVNGALTGFPGSPSKTPGAPRKPRTLRPPLDRLPEYAGAALLEDGSIVLVLEPYRLCSSRPAPQ